MIRRLILKNFMAHKHTEIELDPGLTVLTGPNNTGKSAVVEALRCLATNPIPKHFIRHGAKEALVTAELDDGALVTWGRKEKYAWYEVLKPGTEEPEEYYKFGRRPPEEVTALLRLDPVLLEEHNNLPVDVHLGDQRKPVFLLDLPGSAMASFFAASSESSHLLSMQKLLKKKVTEHKRQAVDAQSAMLRAKALLDSLAPLPGVERDMDDASAILARIKGLSASLPLLEQRLQQLKELEASKERLLLKSSHLASLTQPPATRDTRPLLHLLHGERRLNTVLSHKMARQQALAGLLPVPALADTRLLANRAARLSQLWGRTRKLTARRETLTPLSPPLPPADTSAIARLLKGLAMHRKHLERSTNRLAVLESLTSPPESVQIQAMYETLGRFRSLEDHVAACRDRVKKMDQTLVQAHETIAQKLDRQLCPVCGQPFTISAFLGKTSDPKGESHD